MSQLTVAELNVDEFRELIRETVRQVLVELLADDDDADLVLDPAIEARLNRSLTNLKQGVETIPAREIAERLGLEWEL